LLIKKLSKSIHLIRLAKSTYVLEVIKFPLDILILSVDGFLFVFPPFVGNKYLINNYCEKTAVNLTTKLSFMC